MKITISIRLDKQELQMLRKIAFEQNRTPTNMVYAILKDYITNNRQYCNIPKNPNREALLKFVN